MTRDSGANDGSHDGTKSAGSGIFQTDACAASKTACTKASDTIGTPRTSAKTCVLLGRAKGTTRCVASHRVGTICTPTRAATRIISSLCKCDGQHKMTGSHRTSAYSPDTKQIRDASPNSTGVSGRMRRSTRFLPRNPSTRDPDLLFICMVHVRSARFCARCTSVGATAPTCSVPAKRLIRAIGTCKSTASTLRPTLYVRSLCSTRALTGACSPS